MKVTVLSPAALVALVSFVGTLPASSAGAIEFDDYTLAAGINYVGPSFGVSWGDLNGDGLPDAWLGSHWREPIVYLNDGNGVFRSVTEFSSANGDNHGAAWADFDNDGDQDLLILNGAAFGFGSDPNRLLVNDLGTLTDQADARGLDFPLGRGRTPLWLDANNDGYLDALLSNWLRPDQQAPTTLFTQFSGLFNSVDAIEGVRTSADNQFSQLTWLNTGRPGFIIHSNEYPDRVYEFSDLGLIDVTEATGFPIVEKNAQDVVIADFNGDSRLDYFIVRSEETSKVIVDDAGLRAHFVATSDHRGVRFKAGSNLTFKFDPQALVPPTLIFIGAAGLHPVSNTVRASLPDADFEGLAPYTPGSSNGVYIGYDPRTGDWTVVISRAGFWARDLRITSGQPIQLLETIGFESSDGGVQDLLWLQTDNGLVDASAAAGVANATPCLSGAAADFDNDMDLDLYLVCRSWAGNLPNILYENLDGARFREVPNAGGAAGSIVGRGESVATADFDLDGRVDLFVTNGMGSFPFNEGPNELIRNRSAAANWLQLDLEGLQSNRDGVGARIFVTAGGRTQFRLQDGGIHRFSQNFQRPHFGLADNDTVDEIRVEWPSGARQILRNIDANQVLTISECGGVAAADDTAATERVTPHVVAVLDNDECLTDTPLQLTVTAEPASGTARPTERNDGIEYHPNDGFSGWDAFTYRVTDFSGTGDAAEVRIRVNDRPIAVDDQVTMNAGGSRVVDILANDLGLTDAPIELEIVAQPMSGVATLNGAQQLEYAADSDFAGEATIQYRIKDVDGDADVATVILIVINSMPDTGSGLPLQATGRGSTLDLVSLWALLMLRLALMLRLRCRSREKCL